MSVTTTVLAQSIILIAMGGWAYLGLESAPKTALIPVFIGAIIGALAFRIEKSKAIAYVVIGISVLTLIALSMPLRRSLSNDDMMAVGRVSAMLLITAIAIVCLLRHLWTMKNR